MAARFAVLLIVGGKRPERDPEEPSATEVDFCHLHDREYVLCGAHGMAATNVAPEAEYCPQCGLKRCVLCRELWRLISDEAA